MIRTLRRHWPEYLMEAFGLGIFMLSAGLFGTLLEYPGSTAHQLIPDAGVRRALMGLAMGGTAIFLIYYPWGQQSGAHYNPAVTLTFLRLGKIKAVDAACYIVAQFVGGIIGVLIVESLLGAMFTAPPVQYVATIPGADLCLAFFGELAISLLLMFMVLCTSDSAQWKRYTGFCAGLLVAIYITIEAPLSGMSMNPARTLASAWPGRFWEHLWIYFLAPPLGMWLAVDLYRLMSREGSVHCAKLNHDTRRRCIFCGYGMAAGLGPKSSHADDVSVTIPATQHPNLHSSPS